MNKSWKLTAAFAAVLVLVSAVYFFSNPPTSTKGPEDPRVLPGLTSEQVTKIEVDRKGTLLSFEKATDLVGEHWRMVGAISHAAEPALVQQMLFGLDRFVKPGALDPGKPETAPEITGLDPVSETSVGEFALGAIG